MMKLHSKLAQKQNPSHENVKEDFFIALHKTATRV
jgi:hypothetical protein